MLLIRRAKPPSMGCWSFPGGSLELAESIVSCAVREVAEETGITLADAGAAPDGAPPPLPPSRAACCTSCAPMGVNGVLMRRTIVADG